MWHLNVSVGNSDEPSGITGEREYLLGCGVYIVGRSGTDIPFETDLSVSRNHATLTVSSDDGSLKIQDNNSKFGSWLDDRQLKCGEPVVVGSSNGERSLKFGAQKSGIKITKLDWKVFFLGLEICHAKVIPKNETVNDISGANLIVSEMVGKDLYIPKDIETRVELILAWSRQVPFVNGSFLNNIPVLPDIKDHLTVLPFSKNRLSSFSLSTKHPKGDEIIKEFGGQLGGDHFVEIEDLLDYLYLITDKLNLVNKENIKNKEALGHDFKLPKVPNSSSNVQVIFSDNLLRKSKSKEVISNLNSNFKRFKKSQPQRDSLPDIIELEHVSGKKQLPPDIQIPKENFPKARERRKTPQKKNISLVSTVIEGQERINKFVGSPETKSPPTKKGEKFQSDFFKSLL